MDIVAEEFRAFSPAPTTVTRAELLEAIENADLTLREQLQLYLGDSPKRIRYLNACRRFGNGGHATRVADIAAYVYRTLPPDEARERALKALIEIIEDDPLIVPYRHGIKAYLEYGCRCRECERGYEVAQTIRDLVIDEEWSIAEAAAKFGLTRERGRQLLKIVEPSYSPRAELREQAKARRERKARERRKAVKTQCMVCGDVIYRKNARTCGKACWDEYEVLQYHALEGRKESHRHHVANSMLRNPERYSDAQIAYAKRIRAGEVASREGRTEWLIEGSRPFEAAVRAYRRQAPIFAQLPTQIQEQVRCHVYGVERT